MRSSIDPHYPQIILAFTYRGFKVEIDRDESDEHSTYAAWANYEQGCAVAVPSAVTPTEAIRKAKQWIDKKCQH